MPEFDTPFRQRHQRTLSEALPEQIEECVDYLQHPEVLLAEFLESYYLVEGKLDPDLEDQQHQASLAELVLEPYFDSLELKIQAGRKLETICCVGGAFAPLPGELHPALEQQGVDYVGLREGTRRVVLGVTEANQQASAFSLLLRGLNCLAELSPPFQVARLRRHVLREIDPEPSFDLQIGIARSKRSKLETSLLVLTRDLAEVFKAGVQAEPQFAGSIGRIDCVELAAAESDGSLRLRWRV